jgi:hypothetical protein
MVTIDFKNGASLTVPVDAYSKRSASSQALVFARACGFDAPIKKSSAREAQ